MTQQQQQQTNQWTLTSVQLNLFLHMSPFSMKAYTLFRLSLVFTVQCIRELAQAVSVPASQHSGS